MSRNAWRWLLVGLLTLGAIGVGAALGARLFAPAEQGPVLDHGMRRG